MQQNRREFKPWIPTPMPSKSQNSVPDPAYEIIEFPSQQHYSNTTCTSTETSSGKFVDLKCDLCGSSSAKIHCNMCTQQTFCSSCDLMYHRHPKRQLHIRQRITTPIPNRETQPPLPPRGELSPAPIPPPRRNKRPSRPLATAFRPPQHSTLKKDGSFMGSLKRLVGGMHSPSPSPAVLKKEPQPKKLPFVHPTDFEHQTNRRGNDYLDWDSENRHRSGSFTAFHAPSFAPLIQAQSLAQLNCPSCHNRNLSTLEWSRSQMNLNAFPPWPGGAYTANAGWHSRNTFHPKYELSSNNLNRRGSLNQRYVTRGAQYSSDEDEINSDLMVNDDRKTRGVSPAISPRRNQSAMLSDSEEETVSRKSDRRFSKKRTKITSKEPSPALSRRNYLKRCDDDDDALSMRSVGSRRSARSSTNRSFRRQNTTPNLSDSDDELTSDRDNTPSKLEKKPPAARPLTKFPEKHSESLKPNQMVKIRIKPQVAGTESTPKESNACTSSVDRDNEEGWECEYCTYVNVKSSRVCDMCCKSRSSEMAEQLCDSNNVEDTLLNESMANMNVLNTTDVKKDSNIDENTDKKSASSITSPPLQTTSMQTYEELTAKNLAKTNGSKSYKDYSDYHPQNNFTNGMNSPIGDKQLPSTTQDSLINDDYNTTNNILFKSQMKHGLEIIKLLREAENYQFTVEDLTAALAHCGDANPIQWLLENWNKLIESVVTLSTNYGREQPENTIGTISSLEATTALQMHNGDLWAAATECIRQRQKKYDQLMARGNFSREDVVTVLTANHGDLEAAYIELKKFHLKPFLMKIWGPPQGLDNDSGDIKSQHNYDDINIGNNGCIFENINETELSNKNRVGRWLKKNSFKHDKPDRIQNICNNNNNNNVENNLDVVNNSMEENIGVMETRKLSSHSSCKNLTSEYADWSLYSNNILQLPGQIELLQQQINERYGVDMNGDEVDIYNFLIKEYIKLNPREKQYTDPRSSDNTEYDSVSELPVDSITASSEIDYLCANNGYEVDVSEAQLTNNFGQNFEAIQIKAEKVKICLDINDQFKNTQNLKDNTIDYSISSMEQVKFHSKGSSPNDSTKIDHKLKVDLNVHPLFTELNALCLLVKHNLDTYIIGTKDAVAQDTNTVKKWINFNSCPEKINIIYGMHDVKDSIMQISNTHHSNHMNPKLKADEMKALELLEVGEDGSRAGIKLETNNITDDHFIKQSDLEEKNIERSLPGWTVFKKYISTSKLGHNRDGVENKDDENGAEVDLIPHMMNKFELDELEHKKTNNRGIMPNKKEEDQSLNYQKTNNENVHDDLKRELSFKIDFDQKQEIIQSNKKGLLTKENWECTQPESHAEYEKDCIEPENLITNKKQEYNHAIQNSMTDKILKNDWNDYKSDSKPIKENLIKSNKEGTTDLMQKTDLEIQENSTGGKVDIKSNLNKHFNENGKLDCANYIPSSFIDNESKAKTAINTVNETCQTYVAEQTLVTKSSSINFKIQNKGPDEKKSTTTKKDYLKTITENVDVNKNIDTYSKQRWVKQFKPNVMGSQTTVESGVQFGKQSSIFEHAILPKKENDVNNFQTRAQECLSEGLVSTYDQAEIAIQLMELKFDRSQSIDAATECSNIYAAITYLQQECQLCTEKFSMKQMVPSLECEHQCCRDCTEQYYTVQITENSIEDCVCPFCKKPELRDLNSDAILNYFSNLDILLKSLLKPEAHELFQQKLRDWTLMQDPNFKWCAKCSFGFITDPNEKRLSCPSCRTLICAKCGKMWSYEHTGKTCNEYKQWLEMQNDSNLELSVYMENNGIACPKCDTKFILVKGGCMHLTCSQCKYEFCSDCRKSFAMGSNCGVSDGCNKLGLHAHHPRNCLFYLRDKEPLELKQLLLANNIKLTLQASDNQRCQVQLQRETENGFEDTHCGAQVEEAGLCKIHYTEYLANLIRKNKVDPIMIFDLAEILQEFRRRGKSLPVRPVNTFEHEYRSQCIQMVKKEFPLE